MTFTSFNFLIFFPAVVIIYNVLPQRLRVWFLLASSYFFYINMQPIYALLLVIVTISTYLFVKSIYNAKKEESKEILRTCGIIVTLLPLFFFKYFSFINTLIADLLSNIGISVSLPQVTWALPVGISFYTFMAIGYIIDVYNEEVDFEPNFGATGLFLSFFPIVLSGPIERAGNMFPQFKNFKDSTYEDLRKGFLLILWGYFMKLCVADRLGLYIDAVYADLSNMGGKTITLVTLLYPFQVYADLGGYSLTALGAARCIGIKVIPNFNRPFFATSMSEFWRRWHMSLITWLTDYVYTPLSFTFRRWKIWGIFVSLMLTFFISRLWHGASWTFIVWGIVQGIYLSIEALLLKKRIDFERKHCLTSKWWYIFICCGLVFFLFAFSQIFGRVSSINDARIVISKISEFDGVLYRSNSGLSIGLICLAVLMLYDFLREYFPSILPNPFASKIWIVRYISFVTLILSILIFGELNNSQFIYFNF